MTKNTLGETDGTPGAARREMAKAKRDAVKAFNITIQCTKERIDVLRDTEKANDYYACIATLAPGQTKKSSFEYRHTASKAFNEAAKLDEEITNMKKQARKYKWGARKDSVYAFCETWAAKAKKLAP